MPNITAAKKALRVSARKRVFNDRRRKAMREAIKNITKLVTAKNTTEAEKLVPTAYKAIDKAAKQGVIKKNTASRKKSRLVAMIKRAKV